MNYCGQDLQGRSFKGETLEGANFSEANIKGADFTDANLTHTNFSNVQAGVQEHWKVILVIASWLISGISVIFSGLASIFMMVYIVNFEKELERFYVIITFLFLYVILFIIAIWLDLIVSLAVIIIPGGVAIVVAVIGGLITYNTLATESGFQIVSTAITFLIVFCATGTITFAGIVVGAIAVAINRAIVIALGKVGFQFLVVNKDVIVARFGLVVTAVVVATAIISIGEQAFTIDGAEDPKVRFFTIIVILTEASLSAYIGWRALEGDEKNAWIRSLAIAFAAFKGTSFRRADLTDANFTKAILKSTDFRKANLTRTCFYQTKKLDRVRLGSTYLQDKELCQLLVTGSGSEKDFNNRNLRGLNLSGANLANASFIGTDFYQSSLKEADLTGSFLVRTQFESTDLTGAILTGACIEDWVVTRTTKLYNVQCKYVFMKLSKDGDKRDIMPQKGEFKNDDFIIFVQSILDTIKLYHERDVNPNLALYVLQSLSEDYQCTLEIVKVEKRGDTAAIIEVKIPGYLNEEKLKETYYEKYNQYLKFYMTDPKKELKSRTNIENVTVYKGFLIAEGVSNSTVTYTSDTEGDTIMPEGSKQQFNNDLHHAQIAGGLVNADTVSAHQIGGNINNYTPQQRQNLAETAREIQQLLQQLEQTNPTTTTSEKTTVVAKTVDEIEKNSTLKARVIEALKSGGKEALKEAIDHPLVNILMASVEGWQEAEQ